MNTYTQSLPYMQMQLEEKDLLQTVLSDQKRVSRVYTTACLEADCSKVRQIMQQLANDTLQCHEAVYTAMKQMNYYSAPSTANRQEVQKKLQESSQAFTQTQQFMSQLPGNAAMQHNYTFAPTNISYPRY